MVDPDKKRLQGYDYAGNLKEVMAGYLGDDTARQFAYDQHNRLVWQGRSSGSNSWYLYDALGRRIQKTVGNQTTRYIYSGNRIVEEQDMAGNTIAAYAYGRGLDEPVVMQRDVRNASGAFIPDGVMETYYFHTDAQGNVTYLTGEAGELVEAYSYAQETEPWLRLSASQTVPFHNDFGLPTFHDPQTGAAKTIQFTDSGIPSFTDGAPMQSRFGNPFLYNGREWDPELGFYYSRARYLDPLNGRFSTPDPLGPWGDSGNFGNHYTYTGNNPWSRTDPFGLYWLTRVGGAFGMVGGVAEAMIGLTAASGGAIGTAGSFGTATPVSLPLALGGAALTVHAVDTFSTGWSELWTGEYAQSGTSQLVQAATGSFDAGEITNAGIGILGMGAVAYGFRSAEIAGQYAGRTVSGSGVSALGGKPCPATTRITNRPSLAIAGWRKPFDDHHPIPMFMGGNPNQVLAPLEPGIHTQEFHPLLRAELQDAGIPLPIGGRGGSTKIWGANFQFNPGSQRIALDALLDASRSFDYNNGSNLTHFVWQNIVEGNFTEFP